MTPSPAAMRHYAQAGRDAPIRVLSPAQAQRYRSAIISHRDALCAANLLSRGQEISVEADEAQAVMLELKPGEMSLHHVKPIRDADPNASDERRIGPAIRYIPAHVRQTAAIADRAMLVREVDACIFGPRSARFSIFGRRDCAPAEIVGASRRILMRRARAGGQVDVVGSMAKVGSKEAVDRLRTCRGLDPLASRVDRRS